MQTSAKIIDFHTVMRARNAAKRARTKRKVANWIVDHWGLSLAICVVVGNAAIYAGFYYGMCWAWGVKP